MLGLVGVEGNNGPEMPVVGDVGATAAVTAEAEATVAMRTPPAVVVVVVVAAAAAAAAAEIMGKLSPNRRRRTNGNGSATLGSVVMASEPSH